MFGLGIAELAVRRMVRGRDVGLMDGRREVLDEPQLMAPDDVLGWRNLPGSHRFRYRTAEGPIEVTVNVDVEGHRSSGLPQPEADGLPEIAVVGGSFTFGWGVADDQHFVAQLARSLPQFRVINLGVGGYGTYQSLLALEARYADRPPPVAVVLGFASFHSGRNVADPGWRYMLYRFGDRGYTRVPFVSVADGQLVRHAPDPVFPLMSLLNRSTLCTQLMLYREMRAFATLKTDPVDATLRLVAAMRDWGALRGAPLVVAYLDQEQRPIYTAALKQLGIPYALAPEITSLPYDQHPNPQYHAEVARLSLSMIRDALDDSDASDDSGG